MTSTTVSATDTGLRARVSDLTLAQKVRLLTGADFWSVPAEPAIGLRRIVVSDGPVGVRGETWDETDPSACLPSPTALAASWDERRIEALGRLLAAEARRKGVDVLLAPTINLHRSPYGGRHFECFSEDPLLTGRIGTALVRGVQAGGVGATLKHYVANDSETDRMSLDARIDERTLRELYLAPFETIIDAVQPWAIIAAYNGVNGSTMTESPLLADPLKSRWGFSGVVMSDWFAARSNEPAARAALDLAMPGPRSPWADGLVAAVEQGRVDERDIDEKVHRLLVLAERVGALEGGPAAIEPDRFSDADIAAMLRGAAAAGTVLTRNAGVLPLDRATLRRVAVLGPLAETGRTLGGGSATVFPAYTVGPLAGLRAAVGDTAEITHAMGVRAHQRIPVASGPYLRRADDGPGMQVRFLGADGRVLATQDRTSGSFLWFGSFGPGMPDEPVLQVEVHTRLRAPDTGEYTVGASGIGRYRVSVGSTTVVDADIAMPDIDIAVAVMLPPQQFGRVRLEAGEEVDVRLVHEVGSGLDFATAFQLNLERPYGTDDEEIAKAVALARAAEVAVVVVGTNEESEAEGIDRSSLALPGRQNELVRRVAAANPRTVVVVNAGAPVLLPWVDDVAAVLLVWFPGQEFGHALADILLGVVEPGGRLPTTWPSTMDAALPTRPVDGVLPYTEGLLMGYRGYTDSGPRPMFPFGSGVGYTSWQLDDIHAPAMARPDREVCVDVRVRNTGARAGRQVVQAYLSRSDGAVSRPERWLAGFSGVWLEAGAEARVTVTVPGRAFAHWALESNHGRHRTEGGEWAVEAGRYELRIGTSSAAPDLCPPIAVIIED